MTETVDLRDAPAPLADGRFPWDTPSKAGGRSSAAAGKLRRAWTVIAVGAGVLLFVGGAMSMLFGHTEASKHKPVVHIAIVAQPPPPPPRPKEEPPPKPKDEVRLDQPQPTPQEPQPTPQAPPPGPLGLDAQGSGPGDGFGLTGRPGGRDVIAGSGGGGLGYSLLGSNAARQIAQELARNPHLKSSLYKVEIRVWLAKDGRIEREEIVQGTGNRELDTMIRDGLRQISALHITVPDNLPQPLRIRVTSSDA